MSEATTLSPTEQEQNRSRERSGIAAMIHQAAIRNIELNTGLNNTPDTIDVNDVTPAANDGEHKVKESLANIVIRLEDAMDNYVTESEHNGLKPYYESKKLQDLLERESDYVELTKDIDKHLPQLLARLNTYQIKHLRFPSRYHNIEDSELARKAAPALRHLSELSDEDVDLDLRIEALLRKDYELRDTLRLEIPVAYDQRTSKDGRVHYPYGIPHLNNKIGKLGDSNNWYIVAKNLDESTQTDVKSKLNTLADRERRRDEERYYAEKKLKEEEYAAARKARAEEWQQGAEARAVAYKATEEELREELAKLPATYKAEQEALRDEAADVVFDPAALGHDKHADLFAHAQTPVENLNGARSESRVAYTNMSIANLITSTLELPIDNPYIWPTINQGLKDIHPSSPNWTDPEHLIAYYYSDPYSPSYDDIERFQARAARAIHEQRYAKDTYEHAIKKEADHLALRAKADLGAQAGKLIHALHTDTEWAMQYVAQSNSLLDRMNSGDTSDLSSEELMFTNSPMFRAIQALKDPAIFQQCTDIYKEGGYFGGLGTKEQAIMDDVKGKLADPESHLARLAQQEHRLSPVAADILGSDVHALKTRNFYFLPPGAWGSPDLVRKATRDIPDGQQKQHFISRISGLLELDKAANNGQPSNNVFLGIRGLSKGLTPYFVLQLQYNGSAFTVAECAESGNATYIFKEGTNDLTWTNVFNTSKKEALGLGAQRLIHDPGAATDPTGQEHMFEVLRKMDQM